MNDIKKPKMTSMKGKWLKASKFKDFLPGLSIFPVKSPHNNYYSKILKQDETFYLSELFEHLQNQSRPVKCLINLSEALHYTSDDLKKYSIDYHRISIKGKSYPSDATLAKIFELFDKYTSANETVVIHCKHGLNRTGYVIVAYLIKVKGMSAEEAIKAFEEARGMKIENKGYLSALGAMGSKKKVEI